MYSYEQLAGRIGEVLGETPSLSTLRAAASTARRSRSVQSRPRLTYGMPAPEPAMSRTAAARFSVSEVEAWLADHPRLRFIQAAEELRTALRQDDVPTEDAVARARRAGLTWAQITEELARERGDQRTRVGIWKAYRHLDAAGH